ncbi:MAG TPA: Crp/Fnr family transcriptional regulator, partial [Chloroflexota bacterium]|nr:Crp/Fnr family transcriptional regulator [Chloroflexota bacterium]
RGQFIFLEEDPIEALHVLVEGHVKMIRETEDGREVILRVVCPSEVFGIAGFGAQMAQRFSAQANEDATVIEIPTEEFIQILSVSPPSLQSTLRTIGALLREVESRICDLQTKDAESRLAGVLAQLATSSATPAASVPFTLALTRQDLADLAGTNLSTASRTVSAWAKAGFLSVGRAKIVVRDVGSLAAIARGARLPEIDRRSDTGR